ncbi:PREDICTED: WAS/WASL-interacting protein family member 3-like [Branchiostoma belcheri]|uniref:WAS/WASL-interacting protein family member 3-like n=1 Tax=Branchiostoma belcheri TaxID=7741 RepID=A0A6P4YXC0_BRABE|nr:PREDICTED: WAS/WASL-interacting protein family member 3-like [Branchiostoma belcheri]
MTKTDAVWGGIRPLRCRAITALIDPRVDAKIKTDDDGYYYVIPHYLADQIIKNSPNVPVYLQHNSKYSIGRTLGHRKVTDRKIYDRNGQVIETEFIIDNPAFLKAVIDVTKVRANDVVGGVIDSKDGFVEGGQRPSPNDNDFICPDLKVPVTAQSALMQKFPSTSFAHNKKTQDVTELSICLSGLRPFTVIDQVKVGEGDELMEGGLTVEEFTQYIGACHSVSNGALYAKTTEDLLAVGAPIECLSYSMSRLDEEEAMSSATSPQQPPITSTNPKPQLPPRPTPIPLDQLEGFVDAMYPAKYSADPENYIRCSTGSPCLCQTQPTKPTLPSPDTLAAYSITPPNVNDPSPQSAKGKISEARFAQAASSQEMQAVPQHNMPDDDSRSSPSSDAAIKTLHKAFSDLVASRKKSSKRKDYYSDDSLSDAEVVRMRRKQGKQTMALTKRGKRVVLIDDHDSDDEPRRPRGGTHRLYEALPHSHGSYFGNGDSGYSHNHLACSYGQPSHPGMYQPPPPPPQLNPQAAYNPGQPLPTSLTPYYQQQPPPPLPPMSYNQYNYPATNPSYTPSFLGSPTPGAHQLPPRQPPPAPPPSPHRSIRSAHWGPPPNMALVRPLQQPYQNDYDQANGYDRAGGFGAPYNEGYGYEVYDAIPPPHQPPSGQVRKRPAIAKRRIPVQGPLAASDSTQQEQSQPHSEDTSTSMEDQAIDADVTEQQQSESAITGPAAGAKVARQQQATHYSMPTSIPSSQPQAPVSKKSAVLSHITDHVNSLL